MEHRAFTRKANGRVDSIETPAGIFVPAVGGALPTRIQSFKAIWDTGATNTAIASSVVKKLGIKPITFTQVGTGGGVVNAPVYLVNILLPDNVHLPNVRVTELSQLNNCDVLIGMDIISHGDFAITHVDGKACFSFRIPSMKEVDFVPEAIQRNTFLKTKAGQIVARTASKTKTKIKRKTRPKPQKKKHKKHKKKKH